LRCGVARKQQPKSHAARFDSGDTGFRTCCLAGTKLVLEFPATIDLPRYAFALPVNTIHGYSYLSDPDWPRGWHSAERSTSLISSSKQTATSGDSVDTFRIWTT